MLYRSRYGIPPYPKEHAVKIIVTRDDGTEHDVTEGVQIAYDIAYGSMDWGSGFLDLAEMEAVAKLAETCGFPSYSDALDSVARTRKEQEEQQARYDRERQKHLQAIEDARIERARVVREQRTAQDERIAALLATKNT